MGNVLETTPGPRHTDVKRMGKVLETTPSPRYMDVPAVAQVCISYSFVLQIFAPESLLLPKECSSQGGDSRSRMFRT